MERFGVIRNIDLITRRLGSCEDIPNRDYFLSLICSEQRFLAVMDARERGASEHGPYSGEYGSQFFDTCLKTAREDCEDSFFPCVIVDPRPGLKIVGANAAGAALLVGTTEDLIGCPLYDTALAISATCDGGAFARLFAAFGIVMGTGAGFCLNEQLFALGRPTPGHEEHSWHVQISPILDSHGEVMLIHCELLGSL